MGIEQKPSAKSKAFVQLERITGVGTVTITSKSALLKHLWFSVSVFVSVFDLLSSAPAIAHSVPARRTLPRIPIDFPPQIILSYLNRFVKRIIHFLGQCFHSKPQRAPPIGDIQQKCLKKIPNLWCRMLTIVSVHLKDNLLKYNWQILPIIYRRVAICGI